MKKNNSPMDWEPPAALPTPAPAPDAHKCVSGGVLQIFGHSDEHGGNPIPCGFVLRVPVCIDELKTQKDLVDGC